MSVWLGLDLGTTGLKAALLNASGEILQSAYRAYPSRSQAPGWVEQQAEDWRQAAQDAVRVLDTSLVTALALTGQMQDVILCDETGRPLRPVILYSDSRAALEAAQLDESVGRARLWRLTGNEQGASGVLAKLRWLAAHEGASLERATHLFLGAAEYLAFLLTGVAASDSTTASTTGLLELASRRWLGLEQGLPPQALRLLPKLVDGGAEVGALRSALARDWGLKPGLPVHLGPGDAGAATLGAGGGVPKRPYAYLGASGWVAFTSEARAPLQSGVFTLAHPDPQRFICVAPLLSAGGNLDWLLALFGLEDHAALVTEALERPVSSLLYLPYLKGERSPFNDPDARAAFIGLNASHSRGDLARAVLEGVAFAYRHLLDALLEAPPDGLVLTGGGARASLFCQLIADVTGLSVTVLAEAEHVGIRGAVLAAQVWRGEREGYGVLPAARQVLRPQPSALTDKYELFRQAYPALRPLFQKMAAAHGAGTP